jgi:hypothetical protein
MNLFFCQTYAVVSEDERRLLRVEACGQFNPDLPLVRALYVKARSDGVDGVL